MTRTRRDLHAVSEHEFCCCGSAPSGYSTKNELALIYRNLTNGPNGQSQAASGPRERVNCGGVAASVFWPLLWLWPDQVSCSRADAFSCKIKGLPHIGQFHAPAVILAGGAPQLNCVPHSSQVSFCIGTAPVSYGRSWPETRIFTSRKGEGLHQLLVLNHLGPRSRYDRRL